MTDDEARYRIYALGRALDPGDSLRLSFDVAFRPRGFSNEGAQTQVAANGSNFDRRLFPIIGYQPVLELSDDETRRRFGLAPRPPMPARAHGGESSRWRCGRDIVQVRR